MKEVIPMHRKATIRLKTIFKYCVATLVCLCINQSCDLTAAAEEAQPQDGEFDVSIVSDITAEELQEYAPDWCDLETCELIVELSQEYSISSEFALSVFTYEYVPERNSVGGWKNNNGKYAVYNSLQDSIEQWYINMSETYLNQESWHYSLTGSTLIKDIAPVYCQGSKEYSEKSKFWFEKINNLTLDIEKSV